MSSMLACIRLLFFISRSVVMVIFAAEIFPEFINLCVLEVSCRGAFESVILPVLISSRYASNDASFAEIIVPELSKIPLVTAVIESAASIRPLLVIFH